MYCCTKGAAVVAFVAMVDGLGVLRPCRRIDSTGAVEANDWLDGK
jgi:hypothetical protein